MDPSAFVPFKVSSTKQHTHNVKIIELTFIPRDQTSTFEPSPIASCVLLARPDDPSCFRPYTPIAESPRTLLFAIKIYPDGKLTPWLAQLNVSDEILVKGPLPKINYIPNKWKEIFMICGGTGITPMYQVLRTIAENPSDKSHVILISAQKSFDDILLLEHLQKCAKLKPEAIDIHFRLDESKDPKKEESFEHEITYGMIDEKYLKRFMPKTSDYIYLVCGPEPMMKAVSGAKNPDKSQGPVSGYLADLGIEHVFKF